MTAPGRRPLVMHVVHRFAVGGLENGVVNLINGLPETEFQHVVVALTRCDPAFCRRIRRSDVDFVSLEKPPGQGWRVFRRIFEAFRAYQPAIVHTRNLAALEMQLPAWIAGVPARIHGEHGRDASDPDGANRRYRLVRRVFSPLVTHYVAVSGDLERYLVEGLRIDAARVTQIYNGVDDRKFSPAAATGCEQSEALRAGPVVVGTVGRLDEIKGHRTLVAAVFRLLEKAPGLRQSLRVRIVGDGPMRAPLERDIAGRGLGDIIELLGERDDVAEQMRRFDVFVLPSLGEGISNTILEAMATGLPIVATAVGGNPELVTDGRTGTLVPPSDADAMACAIAKYLDGEALRAAHGRQGRADVRTRFSLSAMVERYRALYHTVLARAAWPRRAAETT